VLPLDDIHIVAASQFERWAASIAEVEHDNNPDSILRDCPMYLKSLLLFHLGISIPFRAS